MIYLIGGVARSGKSSVRKHLLRQHRISGMGTDSLRTIFELSFPELGIHYKLPPMVNAKKMEPFVRSFIAARFFVDEDFVLEGDCIIPETIKEFVGNKNMKIVFLAYPELSVEEKVAQLVREREGWVAGMERDEIEERVRYFIADSKTIANECATNDLQFIDTSRMSLDDVLRRSLDALGLK